MIKICAVSSLIGASAVRTGPRAGIRQHLNLWSHSAPAKCDLELNQYHIDANEVCQDAWASLTGGKVAGVGVVDVHHEDVWRFFIDERENFAQFMDAMTHGSERTGDYYKQCGEEENGAKEGKVKKRAEKCTSVSYKDVYELINEALSDELKRGNGRITTEQSIKLTNTFLKNLSREEGGTNPLHKYLEERHDLAPYFFTQEERRQWELEDIRRIKDGPMDLTKEDTNVSESAREHPIPVAAAPTKETENMRDWFEQDDLIELFFGDLTKKTVTSDLQVRLQKLQDDKSRQRASELLLKVNESLRESGFPQAKISPRKPKGQSETAE